MNWDLPISVEIRGKSFPIRNNCDYRVVLDVISALTDEELELQHRLQCALFIFYEDLTSCDDIDAAIKEMMRIVNNGEEETSVNQQPVLMDWKHDFKQIAPPVSRIIGYDIRIPDKYTHWYTFLGGYMEIGECVFSTVVSIRSKRAKGKKLEKWEIDFLREHRDMVELPQKMTVAEQELLYSQW